MIRSVARAEHVELEHAEEHRCRPMALAGLRAPPRTPGAREYDWDVIPRLARRPRVPRLWPSPAQLAGGEFPRCRRDGSKLAWIEFNDGRVQTVIRSVEEITAEAATETY